MQEWGEAAAALRAGKCAGSRAASENAGWLTVQEAGGESSRRKINLVKKGRRASRTGRQSNWSPRSCVSLRARTASGAAAAATPPGGAARGGGDAARGSCRPALAHAQPTGSSAAAAGGGRAGGGAASGGVAARAGAGAA
jgi:hypothetical protein